MKICTEIPSVPHPLKKPRSTKGTRVIQVYALDLIFLSATFKNSQCVIGNNTVFINFKVTKRLGLKCFHHTHKKVTIVSCDWSVSWAGEVIILQHRNVSNQHCCTPQIYTMLYVNCSSTKKKKIQWESCADHGGSGKNRRVPAVPAAVCAC